VYLLLLAYFGGSGNAFIAWIFLALRISERKGVGVVIVLPVYPHLVILISIAYIQPKVKTPDLEKYHPLCVSFCSRRIYV
jgi:hypothetical protein